MNLNKKELFKGQRETIDKAIDHPRFLISNEPRTGKTFTSLMLIKMKAEKENIDLAKSNIIIIVPLQTINDWKMEFMSVFDYEPIIVNDYKTKKQRANLLKNKQGHFLCGVDTFRTLSDFFLKMIFDFTIIDEAHTFGNNDTTKTRKCKLLNKRSKNLYLLTATPASNNATKFFFILYMLDNSIFRTFKSYKDLYCASQLIHCGRYQRSEIIGWNKDGLKIIHNFLEPIRTKFTMKEMGITILWNEKDIFINPSVAQKKLYNDIIRLKELWTPNGTYISLFSNAWQLSAMNLGAQICSTPEVFGVEGNKMKAMKELLVEYPDYKFIFCCRFSNYLEKHLQPNIPNSAIIKGDVSTNERTEIINQFQSNKIKHLLCQEKTIGTGITLNKADAIVFITMPWDPVAKDQIRARISNLITDENKVSIKDVFFLTVDLDFDKKNYDMIIIHKTNLLNLINKHKKEITLTDIL